ncbi:MAG: hypothetical protein HFJ49_00160 [Clostridia bacterium]|nr:hypothetical protein [Clostridia bacterium]
MENATKALLIAAAVLISILVISIGLIVFRMASGTIQDANLNEAEIASFNEKFQAFQGKTISGSKVNAMLRTVLSHNTVNTDAGKKVSVTGDITLAAAATALPATMADTGKTYTVTCTIGPAGYITTISVTLNNK